jgi:hypothetical protein
MTSSTRWRMGGSRLLPNAVCIATPQHCDLNVSHSPDEGMCLKMKAEFYRCGPTYVSQNKQNTALWNCGYKWRNIYIRVNVAFSLYGRNDVTGFKFVLNYPNHHRKELLHQTVPCSYPGTGITVSNKHRYMYSYIKPHNINTIHNSNMFRPLEGYLQGI